LRSMEAVSAMTAHANFNIAKGLATVFSILT